MVVLFFRFGQGGSLAKLALRFSRACMRGGALDGAFWQCKKSPEQRLGMTQVSRGVCTSDDAEIAYLDAGDGAPIVLVHGFASTKEANWVAPGWIDTLTRAGRRAIALDNRGHGESSKLYDPARYHSAVMAEDVRALMDHLGLARADLMGYSMGARNAAFLALAQPDRVGSLILGGLGIRLVEGVGLPETIAEALEAPSITQVTDPQGYAFRAFAQQTKSDLRALAACIRGSRQTVSRAEAGRIAAPTLIGVGTKDPIAGSAQELAALLPNAVALDIPGRDHMLAVGDKVFKSGVLAFLEKHA
jgi:pimeloyl-ACP methyl ester carboxylesterase